MSKTTDFIINNPGLDFDGSPLNEFDDSGYTPATIYSELPTSKEQLIGFVSNVRENILEGRVSYQEALVGKKLLIEALDKIFSDPQVKDLLETEHAKHGKKVMYNGAEINFTSRKNHQYEGSGCKFYKQLKQEIKDREKFLLSIKEPLTIVDDKTGEVSTIYPVPFTTTEYFTVSIKA